MRKLVYGLLGAAALAVSTSAVASITIGSVTPGTNPYSGPAPTYDFDTPGTTPGFTGGNVVTGTPPGNLYAQPFGSTGFYYSVGPSTSSPGTIDLAGWGDITSISFLWGSVDDYNTLEFLDAMGGVLATFTGTDIFNPANGDRNDPNLNPVVTFLLDGGDEAAFAGLRLSSTTNAFEIDNIAINPVPEPGTWAMMLLGFGAAGFAMRRRRAPVLAQAA